MEQLLIFPVGSLLTNKMKLKYECIKIQYQFSKHDIKRIYVNILYLAAVDIRTRNETHLIPAVLAPTQLMFDKQLIAETISIAANYADCGDTAANITREFNYLVRLLKVHGLFSLQFQPYPVICLRIVVSGVKITCILYFAQ